MRGIAYVLVWFSAFTMVFASAASAQTLSGCSAYFDATANTKANTVAVVPEGLLSPPQESIKCFVKVLLSLKNQIGSTEPEADPKNRFLSASAAIRTLFWRAAKEDEEETKRQGGQSKPFSDTKLFALIRAFREAPDNGIDVTSVLAYGARNQNAAMRLNALSVLVNVIENSTLCVPVAHLTDPDLTSTEHGRRGRANLLTVLSVVAPWAYAQNYYSIEETAKLVRDEIESKKEDDVAQTLAILKNISDRLNTKSNIGNDLRPDTLRACRAYFADYKPALPKKGNFRYDDPQAKQ